MNTNIKKHTATSYAVKIHGLKILLVQIYEFHEAYSVYIPYPGSA